MTALVASVFVAALLGSVHCAAMCGSFACLASGGTATAGAARSGAAYNGGRLVAYAMLGLLAGAAGAGLDRAGAVAGIARPAAMVAGTLLILWGLATLLSTFGVRLPALAVPPVLARVIARGVRAVQHLPPTVRALTLGLLTAALPCGWLYAFVATSAAAGSAPAGALVMAAFWAGTLPMMTAVGLGAQRVLGPFRRRLPALSAAVMVILGGLTVAGRFVAPAQHHAMGAPAALSATEGGDGHGDHR